MLIGVLSLVLFHLLLAIETALGIAFPCVQCYSVLKTSITNAMHVSSLCFKVYRLTPLKVPLVNSFHSHSMILS